MAATRGTKLTAVLLIVAVMLAAGYYLLHASRQAAEGVEQIRIDEQRHSRQLEQAIREAEEAMSQR